MRKLCSLLLMLLAVPAIAGPKKPITHADYDIWNSVTGMTLSPNGNKTAHYLVPPKGDVELVIRDIPTGKVERIKIGRSSEVAASLRIDGSLQFAPNSMKLFFSMNPKAEERSKAKKAKKKLPKPAVAIYDLKQNKIVQRVEDVKSFQVAGTKAGVLLLAQPSTKKSTDMLRAIAAVAGAMVRPKSITSSDLVIRDLATDKQRTLKDVSYFSPTDDDEELVFIISGSDSSKHGVYITKLMSDAKPRAILTGAGDYGRITWDDEETQLAFYQTIKPKEKTEAETHRLFLWKRSGKEPAQEIVGPKTTGFAKGMVLSDRSSPRFTKDGLKLLFNVIDEEDVKPTPSEKKKADTKDAVILDLWHWQDEDIQPKQKVQSRRTNKPTYEAIHFLDTGETRQLTDDEDVRVTVPGYGDWGLTVSDKPYRATPWRYPTPRDYQLIDLRTGKTKELLLAHDSGVSTINGDHFLHFNGRDWLSTSTKSGKRINLTAKLKEKFYDEEFDIPTTRRSYGIAGWTKDRKAVLLSDRYDIWKFPLDGGTPTNLTKIGRTQNLSFRFTEVEEEFDSNALDLTMPLLLSATNELTRDEGFYRYRPKQAPKLLMMSGRNYGRPTLSENGKRLIFTAQTFYDYPDYYVADRNFTEVKRVSDINPKVRDYNWGRAELVNYTSVDGVPLAGILIKPEDFDPSKKYPMMVYIYERLSSRLHRFSLPKAGTSISPTYYASNGYLVFMPDIAYSTGVPGQSAMKCVLPAIQAVVNQGFVNNDAIGIQGHSWGGYQIAYMVTQTDRFAAASAGAPVSNMTSAYGGIRWGSGMSRQFQYERTQSRIGKTLWQAPLKYIENSPVFHADRVHTPLMMLHNDQDDAVPWYQGIEMFMAMRRLNKEAYLFNYVGEPHGLRKRQNQQDYTLRMQQFFDHHLKGKPKPDWMKSGINYEDRESEKEQWKKLFEVEKK